MEEVEQEEAVARRVHASRGLRAENRLPGAPQSRAPAGLEKKGWGRCWAHASHRSAAPLPSVSLAGSEVVAAWCREAAVEAAALPAVGAVVQPDPGDLLAASAVAALLASLLATLLASLLATLLATLLAAIVLPAIVGATIPSVGAVVAAWDAVLLLRRLLLLPVLMSAVVDD